MTSMSESGGPGGGGGGGGLGGGAGLGGRNATRLRGLIDLFERMRERPPYRGWRHPAGPPETRTGRRHGGRRTRVRGLLRPVLLVLGPAAEPGGPVTATQLAAQEFADRCRRERQPFSDVSALSDDLPAVLREVKRELANRHPRGEPPLRFPLLDMALWLRELREIGSADEPRQQSPQLSRQENENIVLVGEIKNAGATDEQRKQALHKVIRQRGQHVLRDRREEEERGRFATFLGYLEQIAPIGVAVVALVSATAASTVDLAAAMLAAGFGLSFVAGEILARTRGWYGVRRYRWFTRQPYLRGDTLGFLGFALNVVHPGARRQPADVADQLDLLLVAALLEDLRRAYERTFWRATWARVRYPVVIFEQIDPGHVGTRFIRLVERVRADAVESPDGPRPDPLLITAGLDPVAHPELFRDLTGSAPLAPGGASADERAGAPVAALDAAADRWWEHLAEQRRVAVLGTRRHVVVDATADGGGPIEEPRPPRRRPWMAHPALPWLAMAVVLAASSMVIVVESVRYCDPHAVWHAPNGECIGVSDGSYVFSKRLSGVEGEIAQLNRAVVGSGKPYITIVYLGSMTPDPQSRNPQADLLSGTHGELVGLAIAQRRHNEADGQPGLRVLLANVGSRFRYAPDVAGRISAQAVRDRTIVAVVGFGQSRRQTQEAIDVLSKAALPMVGTVNTYDRTAYLRGGFSPYYFRLAPSNRRLAEHAARWARNGLTGPRARTADIFYDAMKDDLYSGNLATDFRDAFGASSVRMLPYGDATQVPRRVQEACEHPADIFYFAGRSDEFRAFVNLVSTTSCGAGPRVVLAADEVTKYVSDNAVEIGANPSIKLFFTPLAAGQAWEPRWVGAQRPRQVFFSEFDRRAARLAAQKVPVNEWPSRAHAALGYDSAQTIISVAARIYGDQEKSLPTVAAILSALTEPGPGALPQGASGLLRFGPRAQGHEVPDKPVLLVTVEEGGGLRVLSVCGQLVEGTSHTAGCPAR